MKLTLFLLSFLLFSLLHRPTFASKKSYVVYLGGHSHGPEELSSVDLNQVTESHYHFLGPFLKSGCDPKDAIFYSYTRHINGFAAKLEEEEAAEIAKHPKVISVFLNQGRKLHTTHSWEFLGLENHGRVSSNSIWKKARYGEDTIIGNLDTGVWPESKSFIDEGLGPIPSKWKGICQNEKDATVYCNRKLIGARYFNKGYASVVGPLNSSFDSPRDTDGHGSHTLSTAGVGASTIDRDFPSYVVLGDQKRFKGQSLSDKGLPGSNKYFPLITGADAKGPNSTTEEALLCENGKLDPKKVKGKILVCLRGENSRVEKGEQAILAGAVGMVLANRNDTGNEIVADPHLLPASHINYNDGVAVFSYINSTKNPVAYLTRATVEFGIKPAPFIAAFSSKGPNTITPEILKPDITAPGVSIIAAYTAAKGPTNEDFDKRRTLFNCVSGTSMSCPHVSGIVGLLKTLHPDWSPAAIRSAIMTTATIQDNSDEPILNASYSKATPFSYGAGHVQPNLAADPGLVYDLTINDYLNFLCALGYNQTQISVFSDDETYKCPKYSFNLTNFNYPSITVPKLSGSITVSRTVKNVGNSPGTYRARVKKPTGISVSVEPKRLKFTKTGEEKTFFVTIKVRKSNAAKEYVFGELIWSDDKQHQVRSPIVVKAI
ncbi:hypothetical protein QYF36_020894 [Acer negundo]|nr:hypothetical protein QYF36_020894 [Acer negundo]